MTNVIVPAHIVKEISAFIRTEKTVQYLICRLTNEKISVILVCMLWVRLSLLLVNIYILYIPHCKYDLKPKALWLFAQCDLCIIIELFTKDSHVAAGSKDRNCLPLYMCVCLCKGAKVSSTKPRLRFISYNVKGLSGVCVCVCSCCISLCRYRQ